jgi:hypothetical protein
MIRFYFLLVFLLGFLLAPAQRKIYLDKKADDNGCWITSGFGPGDTLVLRASLNPWSYVYLGNVHGTAKKPIVLINEGKVEMSNGISVEHGQYIKITGSGSADRYGFSIKHSSQVAVAISGRSAHIEVERFYAEDCAFGCWIKNEADCDTTINNWVLNDMKIHDFEMRNIRIEGFYMGSTDPNNFSRPKVCNGEQKFYKPSKLGNIKVYNGLIDGTGRPAIMLCNAQVGMSEIYNNTVRNSGREFNDQQGTGISIGGYTRAYVHHNKVSATYTWGIASLGGSGLLRIEHNTVDSSGYLDGRELGWPQNIMIDTRPTIPADSTQFIIRDNMVSNPGRTAKNIEVFRTLETYRTENIICNNTERGKPAGVRVAPGIRWRNCKGEQQLAHTSFFTKRKLALLAGGMLVLVALVVVVVARKKRLFRHPATPAMHLL